MSSAGLENLCDSARGAELKKSGWALLSEADADVACGVPDPCNSRRCLAVPGRAEIALHQADHRDQQALGRGGTMIGGNMRLQCTALIEICCGLQTKQVTQQQLMATLRYCWCLASVMAGRNRHCIKS